MQPGSVIFSGDEPVDQPRFTVRHVLLAVVATAVLTALAVTHGTMPNAKAVPFAAPAPAAAVVPAAAPLASEALTPAEFGRALKGNACAVESKGRCYDKLGQPGAKTMAVRQCTRGLKASKCECGSADDSPVKVASMTLRSPRCFCEMYATAKGQFWWMELDCVKA